MNRRVLVYVCWGLAATALSTACRPSQIPVADRQAAQHGVELHVLVVDDPAMAEAIGRLGADWKARTGAGYVVDEIDSAALMAADSLPNPADAVIFPSCQLGLLATRDWIVPLPADYTGSEILSWPDVFELLKVAETNWAGKPYGVSFGSPVLTCFYRADLLRQHHRQPPRTWSEYHELAEFFSHRDNLGPRAPDAAAPWQGAIEPLATGWSGRTLLARAAAYAKHRDHYSTLFQIDTMRPLVAGPAFVRALEELVADAKLAGPDAFGRDPAAVRREFFAGHAAFALSWPSHVDSADVASLSEDASIGFIELPGSPKAYNVATRAWENRGEQESNHVPLLCLAGRIGSIAHTSAHSKEGFQLVAWLSGRQWAATISAASAATTVFRQSQLRAPQPWLEAAIDAEAGRQYARSVREALSRPAYLFALRIPGQDEYFSALDNAVARALSGEVSPADALGAAADRWTEITAQRGVQLQRKAYRESLGLEP
jgi:multiple sugar transport system substrate-binding protein